MRTAGGLALAGVVVLASAYAGTLPGPSTPKLNSLAYVVKFDEDEAYWITYYSEPDEWTSLYIPKDSERVLLTEYLPRDSHDYLKRTAPMPPLSGFPTRCSGRPD